MIDVTMISDNNPLTFTSAQEFLDCMKQVLMRGVGLNGEQITEAITQSEVTTRIAKRMLKEKGYAVASHSCFKKTVAHLTPVKKGKDYWYDTADIQAIPNKK